MKTFLQWIDNYLNFEKTPKKNIFWLDTMNFLCEKLNHPELSCPCFHVAGSKGKGSISTMIASILEADGKKVGVYRSPHIVDFRERVGTSNGFFSEEVYSSAAKILMDTVNSIPPKEFPAERPLTWFELVTLFAMLCFKIAKVDYAVYEVGLGGSLDSTNVIKPVCCCIGAIELEHTEYLGDTIEKIATEKGGIIKNSIPVIISPQKECVRKVFTNIANKKNAPIFFVDNIANLCVKDYVSNNNFSYYMQTEIKSLCFNTPLKPKLKLLGEFQAWNATVATIAVKKTLPSVKENIIEQGLSNALLPARFEIIPFVKEYPNIKSIILDGAHTVNSVLFTMNTFKKLYNNNCHLLFACAADKDIEDIAGCFLNSFSKVTLTRPGEAKACDVERLQKAFTNLLIPFEFNKDYVKAIKNSLTFANKENATLLVTGSFYLVAEVKKVLYAN